MSPSPCCLRMSWIQRSRFLPWGERKIKSRDITWIISAVSPIFKRGGGEKTPHQRGSGQINYFPDEQNTIKPQMLLLRGRLFTGFFFLGTILATEQWQPHSNPCTRVPERDDNADSLQPVCQIPLQGSQTRPQPEVHKSRGHAVPGPL